MCELVRAGLLREKRSTVVGEVMCDQERVREVISRRFR